LLGPFARWAKFEENMSRALDGDPVLPAWGAYACREGQPLGIRSVELILLARPTVPPGQPFAAFTDRLMWQGTC
jgi:hypothetical protein